MEKRTELVLTTATDKPFTQVEDYGNGTKISTTHIPVREVSGTLLGYDGYSSATVDTKEHGPVEVQTGIPRFFQNAEVAKTMDDKAVIGKPVDFFISDDGRTVSMKNALGKSAIELDEPNFPASFITWKEVPEYSKFVAKYQRNPDFADVKDFLQQDPKKRNFTEFFEQREAQAITVESIHKNPALVTAVRDDKGKLHNMYVKSRGEKLFGAIDADGEKCLVTFHRAVERSGEKYFTGQAVDSQNSLIIVDLFKDDGKVAVSTIFKDTTQPDRVTPQAYLRRVSPRRRLRMEKGREAVEKVRVSPRRRLRINVLLAEHGIDRVSPRRRLRIL